MDLKTWYPCNWDCRECGQQTKRQTFIRKAPPLIGLDTSLSIHTEDDVLIWIYICDGCGGMWEEPPKIALDAYKSTEWHHQTFQYRMPPF